MTPRPRSVARDLKVEQTPRHPNDVLACLRDKVYLGPGATALRDLSRTRGPFVCIDVFLNTLCSQSIALTPWYLSQ